MIFKSVVYRLPPEPPIGTVVRPVLDTGARFTRTGDGWRADWRHPDNPSLHEWSDVLGMFKELVVVEPDPHPTPWTVGPWPTKAGEHVWSAQDATGRPVMETSSLDVAMRIVDAVNKAATT